MDEYLLSATTELHRNDLLREAEQARIGAQLREPHAWRRRLGEAFIRLGRRMADEPASLARAPGEPRRRIARAADEPRPRTA
jgi:hypothetical protein